MRPGGRRLKFTLDPPLGEPALSEDSPSGSCVLGSPSSSAVCVFRRLTDASKLAPCDSGRVASRRRERLGARGGARQQHIVSTAQPTDTAHEGGSGEGGWGG